MLHDGVRFLEGAREALLALRRAGATVVVFSNSGKRSAQNRAQLAAIGIASEFYTTLLTAGEAAWAGADGRRRSHLRWPRPPLSVLRPGRTARRSPPIRPPPYDAALDLLVPGYLPAGKVRVPSTGGRLIVDGIAGGSPNGHVYVQLSDPERREAVWKQAMLRATITQMDGLPLAFRREFKTRTGWWPLADPSTAIAGAPVFAGAPVLRGRGLALLPPEGIVRAEDGPPINLKKIPDLTKAEIAHTEDAIRLLSNKSTAPRITLRRRRGEGRSCVIRVSINVWDMTRDDQIELADGKWTTFGAWIDSKAGKTRCQSPFRDSRSEAAFLNRFADGTPFIHDAGTSETHFLRRDRNPTMIQLSHEWLVERHEPVHANPTGGAIYSTTRECWLRAADARPTTELIDRLVDASDAPMVKIRDQWVVNRAAIEATAAGVAIKIAFADLVDELPIETETERGADFRVVVESMIRHPVGWTTTTDNTHSVSYRALGTWLRWRAERNPGRRVRHGDLECLAIIDARGAFRLRMKPGLATQLRAGALFAEVAKMLPEDFSREAKAAGIRYDDTANVFAGERWTLLTPEFVAGIDLPEGEPNPFQPMGEKIVGVVGKP